MHQAFRDGFEKVAGLRNPLRVRLPGFGPKARAGTPKMTSWDEGAAFEASRKKSITTKTPTAPAAQSPYRPAQQMSRIYTEAAPSNILPKFQV